MKRKKTLSMKQLYILTGAYLMGLAKTQNYEVAQLEDYRTRLIEYLDFVWNRE